MSEKIIDKCSNCQTEFERKLNIIIIVGDISLCHNCISVFMQLADARYLGLENIIEDFNEDMLINK